MKEYQNVRETLDCARELGIPMSEYTLRRALKSGQIPCRIVGRTYFISWSNLMRWLSCEDGADNPPPAPSTDPIMARNNKIRRISA